MSGVLLWGSIPHPHAHTAPHCAQSQQKHIWSFRSIKEKVQAGDQGETEPRVDTATLLPFPSGNAGHHEVHL